MAKRMESNIPCFLCKYTQYASINCKWDVLVPIINKAGPYAYQVKLQNGKIPK